MNDGFLKDLDKLKGENRRDYFRLTTGRALCSKISIYSVNGKVIKGQRTKVCMENISAGGMSIVTNLNLPLGSDYTVLVEFTLLDVNFEIEAVVVRKSGYDWGLNEYGLVFVLNEGDRALLTKMINRLDILINKSKAPYNKCSLCDQKIEKGCFR